MKIIIISTALIGLLVCYVNCYSKSYAQSHEKRESHDKSHKTPQFIFPAGCSYGRDCWAVNYVDVDPAEGIRAVKDFKCNAKSYDGHKGVDFALSSVAQMNAGVDVFAASAGRVLKVRDGESDSLKTQEELENIKEARRDCGNAVLIDHGNGLQSIYCHLKKGSVAVKPKQKVKAGEKIAQIGQSGVAEFPHLHFGVTWEGGVVDPYTGMLNTEGCGQIKQSMWHLGLPMEYEPVVIFDGGFRAKSPDFTAIQRGEQHPLSISLSSAAFVFWTGLYNVEKGDEVVLNVLDPDGQGFVSRKQIVENNRARQYYFTGRKIGRVQLKRGTYKGFIRLIRKQDAGLPITREKEFEIKVK